MKRILIILLNTISIVGISQPLNLEWAKGLIGNGRTIGNEAAIGLNKNVYLLSPSQSLNVVLYPDGDSLQAPQEPALSIILSKFDSLGNLTWSRNIITNDDFTETCHIAIDDESNAYIAARFKGTLQFPVGNDTITVIGNYFDILLCKLDAEGNYLWVKSFGGDNYDTPGDLVIDSDGFLYVSGNFKQTVDFDPGPDSSILTPTAYVDAFFAKFDSEGNFLWVKQIAGSGNQIINSSYIDEDNNLVLTGSIQSTTDFDPSSNVFNLDIINGTSTYYGTFVAKYDENGEFMTAIKLEDAFSNAVVVDSNGDIYISGRLNAVSDFDPSDNVLELDLQKGNYYIAKYNSSLQIIWAKVIDRSGGGYGEALCLDDSNNLYFAGTIGNSILIGCFDSFGDSLWMQKLTGNSIASGLSIDVFNSSEFVFSGYYSGIIDFDPSDGLAYLEGPETVMDVFLQGFIAKFRFDVNSYIEDATFDPIAYYPNPTERFLILENNSKEHHIEYSIYDICGRTLFSGVFDHTQTVDLQNYPSGIYYLSYVENRNKKYKVVKI